MSTNHEKYKSSIDDWADMWEKAQADGIFKDAPTLHVPTPQAVADDFFGEKDTKPTSLNEVDAKYWKAVAKLSDTHSFRPELIPTILKEERVDKGLPQYKMTKEAVCPRCHHHHAMLENNGIAKCRDCGHKVTITEAVVSKKDISDMADSVVGSANPIRHSSTGADQDMSGKALGNTFTPEDIEILGQLKTKLHDLESKLNSFEGRGENGKKFESQIADVKKKINELSDALNKGWSISQQGD